MTTSDRQTTGGVPVKRNPRDNLRVGGGRPKGVPNAMTRQVKEMILAALDKAGGIDYLVARAGDQPAAFMTLIGKVLPLQVTGDDGGAIIQRIEVVAVQPEMKPDTITVCIE